MSACDSLRNKNQKGIENVVSSTVYVINIILLTKFVSTLVINDTNTVIWFSVLNHDLTISQILKTTYRSSHDQAGWCSVWQLFGPGYADKANNELLTFTADHRHPFYRAVTWISSTTLPSESEVSLLKSFLDLCKQRSIMPSWTQPLHMDLSGKSVTFLFNAHLKKKNNNN